MSIIGIVGEYNPFHNGHAVHIAESRRLLGEDSAVVCVMSGDFVQRGGPAMFDKHLRAEAAVAGGVDLVFELPLPWALSSAEGFARGAVGLLGALGVVTHLSFGSECGDVSALNALALALMEHDTDALIKEKLTEGVSYAAARQAALEGRAGIDARLLEKPNNILAVEYLKAIHDQMLSLTPVTMARSGAGHDVKSGSGSVRSASELRSLTERGESVHGLMPEPVEEVFLRAARQGRGPVFLPDLEIAILSRLRMLGENTYDALPDASEGLGARLCRAAWTEGSIEAVMAAVKTKRYAMSRIRRMTMCAALGVREGMSRGAPTYARVLAANERGRELLRTMDGRSRVPLITKPASIKELDEYSRSIFTLTAAARDLYVLAYGAREDRRAGSDWRTSPAMV